MKTTVFTAIFASVCAVANAYTFSNEASLSSAWSGPMYTNFVSSRNGTVSGVNGVSIPYRIWKATTAGTSDRTIVIVNGHTESYIKYREVIYDFNNNGYNVVSYDQRGQGFTARVGCGNRSFVEKFQNYVDDLHAVMTSGVSQLGSKNVFLYAHSMGGAVGAAYIEQHPDMVRATVLSSPMLGINTKQYPNWVAKGISAVMSLADECALVPGQVDTPTDYDTSDAGFTRISTTTSRIRFNYNLKPFADFPLAQITGTTAGWLSRSLSEVSCISKNGASATSPVLLFQSGDDQYVLPDPQNTFCNGITGNFLGIGNVAPAPRCKLVQFPTAKHEIWGEVDAIKNKALGQALDFYATYAV